MNILASINGSLISENAAKYAAHYAKSTGADLIVLHLENEKDSLDNVHRSFKSIKLFAEKLQVPVETIVDEGETHSVFKNIIKQKRIETIFCSTRSGKRFFEQSFSEDLTKAKLGVEIAIVKIPDINNIYDLKKIGVYARNNRIHPAVFALGAGLAVSTASELVINNELEESRHKMHNLSLSEKRELFTHHDRPLLAYLRLANLLHCPISIYHKLSDNKAFFKEYLISRNIGLLLLSESDMPFLSLKVANPIEEVFYQAPTDCILLYSKLK